ncbi:Tn3 family transposase [Streptomyces sp. NPDC088747]|uniref:Tn3 family transposase n=1 Tax=Streptomyces sp. NPDC088747 TaxID=3365886 RepID=UPI003822243B
MLRVAGSLPLGEVRGHDLIRMLSRDGKPTGLGDAFAHYGRLFKTLHLLQFVSDEGYRRMIGAQRNVTEARHRLARKISPVSPRSSTTTSTSSANTPLPDLLRRAATITRPTHGQRR